MTPLDIAQFAVVIVTLAGAAWGFYTGWLPRWLRRQIGYYELEENLEHVRQNTQNLQKQHEETMQEIQTLQRGQIALAEEVNAEHDGVAVDKLRDAHFGDRETVEDFRRGAGGHDH